MFIHAYSFFGNNGMTWVSKWSEYENYKPSGPKEAQLKKYHTFYCIEIANTLVFSIQYIHINHIEYLWSERGESKISKLKM